MNKIDTPASSAFIPGLLIGLAIGVIAAGSLWFLGPKQAYDDALNSIGKEMIENARIADQCLAVNLNADDRKQSLK